MSSSFMMPKSCSTWMADVALRLISAATSSYCRSSINPFAWMRLNSGLEISSDMERDYFLPLLVTVAASSSSCNLAMIVVASCDLLMTSSREIMPCRYMSIKNESSVTMPHFEPVWMSDWMRNVLLSRMSAAMDGVLIMISNAATRPGLSMRGMSNCEITACNTVESWMRTISCWLD